MRSVVSRSTISGGNIKIDPGCVRSTVRDYVCDVQFHFMKMYRLWIEEQWNVKGRYRAGERIGTIINL